MKIFLTGGTGFIGLPLTRTLIQRGWKVIALVRNPTSAEAKAIQTLGAQLVRGDVTDRESMREAMTGVDTVIHNAGWYKFGITKQEHDTMRAINVHGTENTLRLAIELGISKIVYTSTMVAFGQTGDLVADESFQRCTPPQSYYEQTKTEAHEFAVGLQKRGAPIVIACPAAVIGPGDHSGVGYLVRMYVRGFFPPVLFAADGRRADVYVDDVAEWIARCVEHGHIGETYILSNGNMKHRDMFNFWKQTPGGFKVTLFSMPDPFAILFNRVAEPVERLLGLPIVFCREFALSAIAKWQFSAAKSERDLGMRYRSLDQAWLDTLEGERTIARPSKEM
jgi:dihydroflavonol-4-reductase